MFIHTLKLISDYTVYEEDVLPRDQVVRITQVRKLDLKREIL